jgi:hypothetical protein
MALSKKEKTLIGCVLLVGAWAGLGLGVVQPAWSALSDMMGKLDNTKKEVLELKNQQSLLNADIENLKKAQSLPADIMIRKFLPETQAENQNIMEAAILKLANASGVDVISMEDGQPVAAPKTTTAPTNKMATKEDKEKEDASKKAETNTSDTKKDEPVKVLTADDVLSKFYRKASFRGSYQQIHQFLSALSQHKELFQITGVAFQNEAGALRDDNKMENNAKVALKPVKLDMDLTFVMQKDTATGSPEAIADAETTVSAPEDGH